MVRKRIRVGGGSVRKTARKIIRIDIPKRRRQYSGPTIPDLLGRISECETKRCLDSISLEARVQFDLKRIKYDTYCYLISKIDERKRQLGLD